MFFLVFGWVGVELVLHASPGTLLGIPARCRPGTGRIHAITVYRSRLLGFAGRDLGREMAKGECGKEEPEARDAAARN